MPSIYKYSLTATERKSGGFFFFFNSDIANIIFTITLTKMYKPKFMHRLGTQKFSSFYLLLTPQNQNT